jgi:probable addiction module antidote protein
VPFDAADYLLNTSDVAIFLSDALEAGHADEVVHALATCCRARGAGKVARRAGMSLEQLARALRPKAVPPVAVLMKVVQALGLQLEVKPRKARTAAKAQSRAKPAARRTAAGSRRR